MILADRVGVVRNLLQDEIGESVTLVRGPGCTSLVFMYKACKHEVGFEIREEYDDFGERFEYSKVLYVDGPYENEIYDLLDRLI